MRGMYQRNRYGVNLGGWLVIERWLTPNLFADTDAKDEYHFMKESDAIERITEHRNTFMTEKDWQWLANHHVTFVRLPVGYWVLKSDDGFLEGKKYLDWAFVMAEKYHIDILLDLHAIKGSQNGEMHSGIIGEVDWWQYRHVSLSTLDELAVRYKHSPALWGIEIVNEPAHRHHYFKLLWFYRHASLRLQKILRPQTAIIFHDAFIPLLLSGALFKKRNPIYMDSHFYLLANNLFSSRSVTAYNRIRSFVNGIIIKLCSLTQPVIIGEWTGIIPQPIFDRTPQNDHLGLVQQAIDAQTKTFNKHAVVYCYWNYEAEGRGMYNFRSLVEDGVIKTSNRG